MNAFERVLEKTSKFLLIVAGVAITLMMLHVAADILSKLFFNAPVTATLEIVAWYYMVATVFLPIAWIQLRKKHLSVELFTRKMEPRRLAVLEGFISILCVVYVGILFVLTFEHAVEMTVSGEVQDVTYFDLQVWPSRWFLPIATGTMTLVLIAQAVRDLVFGFTGRGAPTVTPDTGIVVDEA